MINDENDLKGEDVAEKYKQIRRRIQLLNEAFLPIDTNAFRQSMFIEQQVSELLQDKITYVLRTYFNFDLEAVTCPLVKEAALMLPFISKNRGNFGFVKGLLSALLHCQVDMKMGRFSHTDSTRQWIPKVRYDLLIAGLSPSKFREMVESLKPLRDFIREWFIPYEVRCEIYIKEHKSEQQVNTRLTLGYNTELTIKD